MRALSEQEKLEIASSLEDYHKVFFTFFELAEVYFSESISTACINFSNKPLMKLNPKFWDSLSKIEKIFVVCHECLHVILKHDKRNGKDVPGSTPKLVNIAQDITINEMIGFMFKLDRRELSDWKRFCWIDTCFKNPSLIKKNQTYVYYLEKLIEEGANELPDLVDEHEDQDINQDQTQTIFEECTPGDLDQLSKVPGIEHGVIEPLIEKLETPKINFTNIIRKLKKTSVSEDYVLHGTFTHEDRRFLNVSRGVLLPGNKEVLRMGKGKLLTAVFMDVSGTCVSFVNVFHNVCAAFEKESDLFDLKSFVFDTSVSSLKKKFMIGGGTRFDIIENECLKIEAEVGRYPDCVIVITDGYGTPVHPKAPGKWIWLMTKNHSLEFVPFASKHFMISDIVF